MGQVWAVATHTGDAAMPAPRLQPEGDSRRRRPMPRPVLATRWCRSCAREVTAEESHGCTSADCAKAWGRPAEGRAYPFASAYRDYLTARPGRPPLEFGGTPASPEDHPFTPAELLVLYGVAAGASASGHGLTLGLLAYRTGEPEARLAAAAARLVGLGHLTETAVAPVPFRARPAAIRLDFAICPAPHVLVAAVALFESRRRAALFAGGV